jgi:hypothetical protein
VTLAAAAIPPAGGSDPWRTFVVAAVFLALIGLTLRGVASRRRLAVAVGKWGAAAVGWAAGPAGFGLLGDAERTGLRSLGGILLTWIGLIVGLQCTRALLVRVPGVLWKWSGLDLACCGLVAVLATVGMLAMRLGGDLQPVNAAMAAVIVGATALGWSGETRSLGLGTSRESQGLAALVRAGAGLLSIVAVLLFGLAASATDFDPTGFLRFDAAAGLGVVATALVTAAAVSIGSWLLLERIARRPGERLVITLGSLAVLAGSAEWLHTSPIFTGLLAGAILGNLRGPSVRTLAERIHEAEPVLAVALFLLAGLLLGPVDSPLLAALAAMLIVVRLFLKPLAARRSIGIPDLPQATIRSIVRRPAPIAVAIAAAAVLLQDTQLRRTLLAATLVVGATTFLMQIVPRRKGAA